jgi:hypothetical protein
MGNNTSGQAYPVEKGDLNQVEHGNRKPATADKQETVDKRERRNNLKASPPSIEEALSELQKALASDLAGLDAAPVSFGMPARGRTQNRTHSSSSRRNGSSVGGGNRATASMAFELAAVKGQVGALTEIIKGKGTGEGTGRQVSATPPVNRGGSAEIKESFYQRLKQTVAPYVPYKDSVTGRTMMYVFIYVLVEVALKTLQYLDKKTYPVCSRTGVLIVPPIVEFAVYNEKNKTARQRREKAELSIIPFGAFLALFAIVFFTYLGDISPEISLFRDDINGTKVKVSVTPDHQDQFISTHLVDTNKVDRGYEECIAVLGSLIESDLNKGARFSVQAYCSLEAQGNQIIKKMCGLFTDSCMQYALEKSFTKTMNSFFTVFDYTKANNVINEMERSERKNAIFVDGFSLGAFKKDNFMILVDNNTLRLFHLLRFLGLPSVCPSSSTAESCNDMEVTNDITERLKSVTEVTEGVPLHIAVNILNKMFGSVIHVNRYLTQRILDGTYKPDDSASPGLKALCKYMTNPKSVAPIKSISSITTEQWSDLNRFHETYIQKSP